MNKCKDYADLELSKKLKEYGYNEWCAYCITVYDEDFVYDGDPEHPESHKAGDVIGYCLTNKNCENSNITYSMPHLYDVQKWLRKTYGIILTIESRSNGFYIAIRLPYDIHNKITFGCYNEYEDALLDGCKKSFVFIQHQNQVV